MQVQRAETETVGEALRRARLEADLTLRQAAPLLGVDESTLAKYERDQLEPPLHVIGLATRAYRSPRPAIAYLDRAIRVLRAVVAGGAA